jgi:hypothetical protein
MALTAAAGLWLATPAAGFAQYPYQGGYAPGYPGGYYPPGYGYYPGYGGYWNGQAAALDAYANLGVSQEQARILREQSEQAKLETKKKTIDTMAYERANKYWFSDEQADIQAKKVQFAMNNPPLQEITSGRVLNTLLPYIDKAMAVGARGPTIPIDPGIVKQLVVTTGKDNGNIGLLKDVNSLEWPEALDGQPAQKDLNQLLQDATAEAAAKGKAPAKMVTQINKLTEALDTDLSQKYRKSQLDTADFLEGKRFLDRVREAATALKQPGVGKMLAGTMGPQGDTVDEIVSSMSSKGLTFAPCQPGHENAYVAVHRAFVNYALAANAPDTTFRVRVGAPLVDVSPK